MDTIEAFYNKFTYPNLEKYKEHFNIENLYDKTLPPDESLYNKTICIAGCGTLQPFLVANNHKNSEIIAVDVSNSSIEKAKSLCDQYNLNNIKFIQTEFEKINYKFDVILATGVVHHTKNVTDFLNVAFDNLVSGGMFKGFVYYIRGRQGIFKLNKFFVENNFSVNDVRLYFSEHKNNFYNLQQKDDEEIADVWLNPRFREYDMETFYDEILSSKWRHSECSFTVKEQKKLFFELIKQEQ